MGTGTPTVPSPAVSVCVGIFTLLLYQLVFPLGGAVRVGVRAGSLGAC